MDLYSPTLMKSQSELKISLNPITKIPKLKNSYKYSIMIFLLITNILMKSIKKHSKKYSLLFKPISLIKIMKKEEKHFKWSNTSLSVKTSINISNGNKLMTKFSISIMKNMIICLKMNLKLN
jgi:hypothetical protein